MYTQSDSALSSAPAAAAGEGGEGVCTGGAAEGGTGRAGLHQGAAQDREREVEERERVLRTGTWELLDPKMSNITNLKSSLFKEKRAAQVGFKPTTYCLRGRCSTN